MAGAAPQEHIGRSGKKPLDAEVNLVPFIDLLSCCISFLLITAVWTQIAGLQIASSGGPQEALQQKEQTVDLKLVVGEKGYLLSGAGAAVEIPKVPGGGGSPAFDVKSLQARLHTLRASLPNQTAIVVQPEDDVAYEDLIVTVDACVGEELRDVTVAPAN